MAVNRRVTLYAVTAALLFTGVAWTANSLRTLPEQRRRLADRRETMQELQQIHNEHRSRLAAFERVAQRAPGKRPALRALLDEITPEVKTDIARDESHPAWSGWRRREVELRLESVPMRPLLELLHRLGAEDNGYYWRLLACRIEAGRRNDRKGHAVLRLETLEPPDQ